MAAAADSPTDQIAATRRPRRFCAMTSPAQPVAVQSVDNGFDWADAAIGALVASVVLILAAVAATIVRPRQTVQL